MGVAATVPTTEPVDPTTMPRGGLRLVVQVLTLWTVSRIAVLTAILATAHLRNVDPGRRGSTVDWLVFRMAHWDSTLYGAVADRGYPPPGQTCCYQAFFPGFPWIMRNTAPAFGGNLFVAGFVVTQLAAAVAAVLLWRLTADVTKSERASLLAVLFLAVTPMSVFLTVVYSEAIFLALSLAAWLCGRHRRWVYAGVLAGLACTIRINGLFLVAALAVLYVTTDRDGRRWRPRPGVLTLASGPLFVLGWMSWLHHRTGVWNAWTVAQQQGWNRAAAWPWVGARDAIHNIAIARTLPLLVSRWVDCAAMVLIVVLPLVFIRMRLWPEATLLTLGALPLVFSTTFVSSPRYLLVWFPVYVLLAQRVDGRPRLALTAAAVSALAMLGVSVAWGAQWWIA